MAGLSNYAEQKVLEFFFKGIAWSQPATVYLGFFSSYTGDDTTGGTELVGAGYSRQAISFGAYASRRIASSNVLSWTAGAAWGTLPGVGIWDAPTGGNLLWTGGLAPVPNVANGDTFALQAGEVVIELTSQANAGILPYLAQRVLEKIFKNTAHSALATPKAHLSSTLADTEGVGWTELAAGDYAAQNAAFGSYNSSTGEIPLSADVQFTASAGSAWGDVPSMAIKTGSTIVYVAPIVPRPSVAIGTQVTLQAAGCAVGLD